MYPRAVAIVVGKRFRGSRHSGQAFIEYWEAVGEARKAPQDVVVTGLKETLARTYCSCDSGLPHRRIRQGGYVKFAVVGKCCAGK